MCWVQQQQLDSLCVYLDFAGILDIIDVVKGLFNGFPESNHTMIPEHQNLQRNSEQEQQIKQSPEVHLSNLLLLWLNMWRAL